MQQTATKKTTSVGEVVKENSLTPSVAQSVPAVKQDYDIQGFLNMRKQFITEVNKIMVEGSDYHEIQGKKSLAKGGAEKIASIFGWNASFRKDTDVQEAFKTDGLIAFVCTLTKSEQFVGEGRGAATLQANKQDPNKTIKMAQKSAFIDAVLRASGLSDFFTQDLEDHPEHTQPQQPGKYRTTEKQLTFINDLCKQKNIKKDELKDIIKRMDFTNASEIIDYLKGVPANSPQGEDIPLGYPDDIGAK